MVPGPGESIYLWMYRQGLRQRPIDEVVMDLMATGHDVRAKDLRNYWNGWYRHDLYHGEGRSIGCPDSVMGGGAKRYSDYPEHPYLGKPEILNCFVPCSAENKPLVKWSRGTMSLSDARAWPGCEYLAENLRGAQRIVIDVDGDHGDDLDLEAIIFFSRYMDRTCCHSKPEIAFDWIVEHEGEWVGDLAAADLPVSYHLTFGVDRVVPTMHFPRAHVDIVGNRVNSLRYFKNKEYNGLPPLMMDDGIWDEIMGFIEGR